jgi:hypothetical protein
MVLAAASLRRNNGQQNLRGMLGVMVDGILGEGPAALVVEWLADLQIDVELAS